MPGDVHDLTRIVLYAHQMQRAIVDSVRRNPVREPDHVVAFAYAGASQPRIDVDQHVDRNAPRACRCIEYLCTEQAIDDDLQLRPTRDDGGHEVRFLACRDGRCDENRLNAGAREHDRLRHLGCANTDRARGELARGDLRTFVCFGVRTKTLAARAEEIRHPRDVAHQRVFIEQQRRRGNIG